MGYFANGTEGELYEQEFCSRCINAPEDGDASACPVISLHMQWNSDHHRDETKEAALDFFIPRRNGINQKCRMFIDAAQKWWQSNVK
jgi:hypothetical protein